jgi:hypothetical protein
MCKKLAEAIRNDTKTFKWTALDNVPENALLALEMAVIFALCMFYTETTNNPNFRPPCRQRRVVEPTHPCDSAQQRTSQF